jgi:hypothetical protein
MTRATTAALWMLLVATQALAHEIGTTRVTATFPSAADPYVVEIAVDADSLLTKLQLAGGAPLVRPSDLADRDRRIVELRQVFLDQTAIRFDGRRETPAFAYHPGPTADDLSVVRLTGRPPEGAKAVTISYGLALGSFAVTAQSGGTAQQTIWLNGSEESSPISLAGLRPPSMWTETTWRHVKLGYTHILPYGLDHILFVVGLFLLSDRWRPLVAQISAFTVAHSITLALTMYGVVSLPARVVEPIIAVSIAYVAIENLITAELKPWRVALVFSFGLLHGMGFAGVLQEIGLPRSQFANALISFNAGVELGQLSVVVLLALLVAQWRSNHVAYRRWIVQPASLAIALVGAFWSVQRALG